MNKSFIVDEISSNTVEFKSTSTNSILFYSVSLLMDLIGNKVSAQEFMTAQQSGVIYKEVFCNQPFCLEAYTGDSESYIEF